jgi:hypothetical protein
MTENECDIGGDFIYSLTYESPYHGDLDDFAADWGRISGKWTTSTREYGLGHVWEFSDKFDNVAYMAVLKHFHLQDRKDEFPLEVIKRKSPSELAKISGVNPLSCTLGDKRRASQVRD